METTLPPEDWAADDWAETSAALRRLARRLVRDTATAEDLAQGAVVTALTRPPRLLSRAWFERVLRSRAADHGRRERRRGKTLARMASPADVPAPGEIAERLESLELLSEAVRKLRPTYQRVVFLRYFEDLTPKEIAARIDVPVKTVKTHLHRALVEMRQRLDERKGRGWQAALLPLLAWPDPVSAVSAVTLLGTGGLMFKRVATVVALLVLGVCGLWILTDVFGAPDDAGSPVADALVAGSADPAGGAGEAKSTAETAKAEREPARSEPAAMPDPREAEAAELSQLTVHTVWSDGTPAVDVGIILVPEYGRSPLLRQRHVTDGDGIARMGNVRAGKYGLESDRGGRLAITVAAGVDSEERFEIEEGVDVAGVVLAPHGNAQPNAGIWLTSRSTDWWAGRVIARADAAGRFSVRSIPKGQSLGAIHADHTPSELVDLDNEDVAQKSVELQLVLRRCGGNLAGTVVDPDGNPVADAIVCVGEKPRFHRYLTGMDQREVWTPRTARTDTEGGYRLDGLFPGEHPISVCADEFPIWRETVEVEAADTAPTSRFDIRLRAGVTVFGTVTDPAGQAVENARVRAFDIPPGRSFLQGGQIDYDETFGFPSTATDAAGRYRLRRIAPGEVTLLAMRSTRRQEGRAVVRAERVTQTEPGTTLEWNAVLDPGNTIEGVVLYRSGAPMGNVFLSARSAKTGESQTLVNDAKGRFRFVNMAASHHSVSVQYPFDAPKGHPPLIADNVWPDGKELRLVAVFDKPARKKNGVVRGRIADPAGRLDNPSALRVILNSESGWNPRPELDGMSFVFDSAAPGRRQVVAMSGENVIAVGEWFELGDGEDRDIGLLVTEPGGSARLRIQRQPGAEGVAPRMWISPVDKSRGRRIDPLAGDVIEVPNLSAGDYTYRVYGTGTLRTSGSFKVTANRETVVPVRLDPAGDARFEVVLPDGKVGEMEMRIVNSKGEKVWDRTVADSAAISSPYQVTARLPLGDHVLVVETQHGGKARHEFTVTTYGESEVIMRVALR